MADEQDARVLLAEALFSDPKARPVMEDLIAEKFPKAAPTIPGFQLRKDVEKQLAELRKLTDDLKSQGESDRMRREVDAEWQRVVSAGLVSDEDRAEVEKIMAERKTANYEDAAERLAAQRRTAIAAPRSDSRTMQVPGRNGAGGEWYTGKLWNGANIMDNPEEWGRSAADHVVEDIRRGHLSKHL